MSSPVMTPTNQGVAVTAARWRLEIDTAYDSNAATQSAATWIPVYGTTSMSAGDISYTEQNITDYDSVDASGVVWDSTVVTGASWTLTGSVYDKLYAGQQDPGQKAIQDASDLNKVCHFRWFDRFGGKAYSGYSRPKWMPQAGGPTDIATSNFELKGMGPRITITNPVVLAPDAASVSPTTAAAGATTTITGVRFTGVTGASGVKFGGVNATSYTVVSDTSITAVVPAGAAGSAPILVTHPVYGADASPVAFTRS